MNEAGDYSGLPYEQGDIFDFEGIFDTDKYLRRRRWFLEALSLDANGESVGYYLEVSYDGGQSWQVYSDDFDVLTDQCGVWLGADEIGTAMWDALQVDSCQMRITASVESDDRVASSYADGPVGSVVEVVDHVLSLDGKFNFRKVSDRSIFQNSSYGSDEVDDSELLLGYVRDCCQDAEHLIEQITVRTPFVMTGFRPGDRVICSPESRDMLGVRRDSRSCFWIESTSIYFQNQRTRLEILRKRGFG